MSSADTVSPPPAGQGASDPGDIYRYGPSFVRFVHDRFAQVEVLLAATLDVLRRDRPVEGWRRVASGNTDSSGDAAITVVETAPGQKFTLHRLAISSPAYSYAAPFTGAGMVEVQIDGATWDGVSLASGESQIPVVLTSGRLDAIEAQDGETLTVKVTGGPVSAQIVCRAAGVFSQAPGTLLG